MGLKISLAKANRFIRIGKCW